MATPSSMRRACLSQPCRCARIQTSSSRDKSPASKVMSNQWRWVGWRETTPLGCRVAKNYQPVNITFALLAPLDPEQQKRVRRKRDRRTLQVELALKEWDEWISIN